jgi:CheY-like chemotaxis protein
MGKSILLVDYDPHSIGRIRRALRARGYEIHIAKDGPAGIEAFKELRPGLTLAQDLLPRMAGAEVCRIVKDLAFGTDAAAVLIVPACKRGKPGLDAPWCDALFETPFDDEALIALVERFVGPGPLASDAGPRFRGEGLPGRHDGLIGGPRPDEPR